MRDWIEKLRNVSKEYRPMPFWSWNGALEKEELIRQIADMDEKGMGGFFIHARAGLTTPYMGEEWFDCVATCIEEAKKRGMYVWLYDENGWPSGFAGGKLLENEAFLVSAVKHTLSSAWDDTATASFVREGGGYKRVYAPVKKKKYVHIYTYKNHSYVDICNPEVTKAFIEETHEKYYARFGKEFGKTVKGFFTDEPQYFRSGTPYSDQLVEYFKKKYDEDVIEKLPLLFLDGEGDKQFRFRYYSALNDLICHNYFRPIYDWCEAHRCQLTGHGIDERCFSGQMVCSGNVMPFYEYMQLPGMDFLGRFSTGTRIAKQVYSVAKQTGKKRVLTETFAMTGWNVSFDELRWVAEAQYVGGVNFMCQHLYPYAFRGQGRYDHPCAFSDCEPWWEKYGAFNEYFTRLGYMLSESEESTDVAVVHTIKSAYLRWKRAEGYASIADEEDGMSAVLQQLWSFGVPFDIADEALMLSRGRVENGKLVIGERAYGTLVLPYCTALNERTTLLLEEFLETGGKLLVQYDQSIRVDGSENTKSFSSNVTFSELLASAPVSYVGYSEKTVCSYRRSSHGDFVYIVNQDKAQSHKVSVRVRGMQSATVLDLLTLRASCVNVRGETAFVDIKEASSLILLINDKTEEEYREAKTEKIGEFTPHYYFPKENYITLDKAEWSVDGGHYYEQDGVYNVQTALLEKRYEGDVYLLYRLHMMNPPKKIELRFEYKAESLTVNGLEVAVYEQNGSYAADIKKYVRFGENKIIVRTKFYQRPYVYDVLFGEDTTESLLNCLYYDTQLSEMFVSGGFEVQAVNCVPFDGLYRADEFVVSGTNSRTKRTGDTVMGGLPFYRGALEYVLTLNVSEGAYELIMHGRFVVASVSVNGGELQDVTFGKRFFAHLKTGVNTVKMLVYSGNRNCYGPFHLSGEDTSVGPTAYTGQLKSVNAAEYDFQRYYFARFGIKTVEVKRIW
ncbi:MAG: hypothetical protein IJ514_00250 [Clostridia bacterium]|nr:hypothetical protein [Clostridia bacterium]